MFERDEAEARNAMGAFGLSSVDNMMREAIHLCGMLMPPDRRTIDEVEKEIRRMVDRAFRDMREDMERLGP